MRLTLPLLLLCLCTALTSTAQGPDLRLVVTSSSDDSNARDANPGDGECADANGRCTIRAAVDEANASSGDVVIILPGLLPGNNTGTYTLSAVAPNMASNTYEDDNAYGDLDLNGSFSSLTIQGTATPGPQLTISPNDRILDIGEGKTVTIERVWLTGGTARAGNNGSSNGSGVGVDGEDGENGGGIRVNPNATVNLDQVTITGCFTQSGGNGATPASSISRTRGGDAGNGGDGGAIYIASGATVNMTRTSVAENGTGDSGGAGSGQGGRNPVPGDGGDGGNGGGIYNAGTLTATNCTIYNNTCGDAGSGASNSGSRGRTRTGQNGRGGNGGGIANAQFVDGSETNQGTATLVSTIIASNQAGSSASGGVRDGLDLYDASQGGTFSGNHLLIGSVDGVGNFMPSNSFRGNGGNRINPMISGQNQNSDWAVPAYVLSSGSMAIDNGTSNTSNDYDARGFVVGDAGSPDIGAYEANAERIPQDIVINEVDVFSPGGDGEFIELLNDGDYAVQLDDYTVVGFKENGSACGTFNLYGELQPGEVFTVGASNVSNIDQTIDFDRVQNTCGSSSDNFFLDGSGAAAVYFGTASNLSGIGSGTQPDNRKDLVVYQTETGSGVTNLCSDFSLSSGCNGLDSGDGESVQRQSDGSLGSGAPSPGSQNSNATRRFAAPQRPSIAMGGTARVTASPNPTRDVINVYFPGQERAGVRVVDNSGRVVLDRTPRVYAGVVELSLGELPRGLYTVLVTSPNLRETVRVVRD